RPAADAPSPGGAAVGAQTAAGAAPACWSIWCGKSAPVPRQVVDSAVVGRDNRTRQSEPAANRRGWALAMTHAPVLQQFDDLSVWKRGDERAPHKPLLVLYALGRWARGDHAEIPFSEVNRGLTGLLKEFGPSRKSFHPEYPFWRLQRDGVWQVSAPEGLRLRASNSDPPKGELLAHDVHAGFAAPVRAALAADPGLVGKIAA